MKLCAERAVTTTWPCGFKHRGSAALWRRPRPRVMQKRSFKVGKNGNGDLEKADRSAAFAQLRTKAGRREFLRGLGFGAAGAATLGGIGLASTTPARAADIDAEILTFALNLEYLEAEFYSLAVTGQKLPANEIGPNPGPTTGGNKVRFENPHVAALALELQTEETKHVLFLQAALTAATGSLCRNRLLTFTAVSQRWVWPRVWGRVSTRSRAIIISFSAPSCSRTSA